MTATGIELGAFCAILSSWQVLERKHYPNQHWGAAFHRPLHFSSWFCYGILLFLLQIPAVHNF